MSTRYNFFGGLVTDNLILNLDAAKLQSYPGSGTNWINLINNSISGGTLINGPTLTGSGKNLAIRFDGTNDYANLGSLPVVNNLPQLTISSWFIANALTPGVNGWSPIFSKRQSLTVFRPSTEIIFGDSDNGLVPSQLFIRINTAAADSYCYSPVGTIITNVWYNVVMVYNGNGVTNSDKINLYVQGVSTPLSFGGSNIPITTSNPADDARIAGMLFTAQPRYFNGRVATTQIYNRALSQAEITQNFNATRGRYGV
jgi:hypothetical protein